MLCMTEAAMPLILKPHFSLLSSTIYFYKPDILVFLFEKQTKNKSEKHGFFLV